MSNLRLLNETTASSVASLSITDLFSADFNIYKIVLNDLQISTGTWVEWNYINSSGSILTSSEYDEAVLELQDDTSYVESRSTNQSRHIRGLRGGSDASNLGGLVMYIFNPFSSSSYTFALTQSMGYISKGFGSKGIFVFTDTSSVTGINFNLDGQTFNNLTVRTYGLRVDT
tara:strand:- start:223 stop:738 length:516 start_codon:yes stop_codon:yes gene_type:complete